jgi:hypothetical protein
MFLDGFHDLDGIKTIENDMVCSDKKAGIKAHAELGRMEQGRHMQESIVRSVSQGPNNRNRYFDNAFMIEQRTFRPTGSAGSVHDLEIVFRKYFDCRLLVHSGQHVTKGKMAAYL